MVRENKAAWKAQYFIKVVVSYQIAYNITQDQVIKIVVLFFVRLGTVR